MKADLVLLHVLPPFDTAYSLGIHCVSLHCTWIACASCSRTPIYMYFKARGYEISEDAILADFIMSPAI